MADVLTPNQRSRNMSAIRGKDTKPEIVVRRVAHRLGYRFRLHRQDLSGRPDLVFPRLRKVVFVHGCFWHMHSCRKGCVTPKTNADFWQAKRAGNVARDRRTVRRLRADGWKVLVLWECQTRDTDAVRDRLSEFLSCPSAIMRRTSPSAS